jgi:serine/threonine protein kinase
MADRVPGVTDPAPPPEGVVIPTVVRPELARRDLLAAAAKAPEAQEPITAPSAPATLDDLPKKCATCGERYPQDFLLCPRDATPLLDPGTSDGDPLIGKVVGDAYQVIGVVGEGGMGKVYQAQHLRLHGRRFALKVLHPEYARNAEIVARFQREAELSSTINHPNVVSIFDVHRMQDGTPYMVGELLEGEDLGARLDKRGKLDVGTAVSITRQVCRALAAAHAHGIVHRDIKPQNVFVRDRDGGTHVKVLDFGISRAERRDTHLTKTGLVMGTPAYMSPEQARGQKVDARADVYAAGALLYHLVTGMPPFETKDPAVTLASVITTEPARPRSVEPSVPEPVELVIQRSMAKAAADRYATIEEMEAALAPLDPTAAASRANASTFPSGAPAAEAPPGASVVLDSEAARRRVLDRLRSLRRSRKGGVFAKDANLARPALVALGAAGALWLIGGFVGTVGGIVRVARGGELTTTETLLLVIGTLLAVGTPGFLAVSHVRKLVWPNSVRAVELASDLWWTVSAAFVSYGALAILGRVLTTVFVHASRSLGSGLWDGGLFFASVLGAVFAGRMGAVVRAFRGRAQGHEESHGGGHEKSHEKSHGGGHEKSR